MKSIHSGRLERWLGPQGIAELSRLGRGWYGPPIHLLDVPGSVRVCGDGDFVGTFERGYFASSFDVLSEHLKRLARGRASHGQFGSGFAGVADYLYKVKQGYSQKLSYSKAPTGTGTGAPWSAWRITGSPSFPGQGTSPAIDGSGVVCTAATAGALPYNNPATGTMHLTTVEGNWSSSNLSNMLIYDRLWHVGKTMSSVATEAVNTNNLPTRYTNTVAGSVDSVEGNFVFASVEVTLGATAHNWTVCKYTNQGGVTGQSLPSFAGVASSGADRVDHTGPGYWFAPLASGDTGIKNLTQMQCDASVTGTLNFAIGHPIGFCYFPVSQLWFPQDWITNRNQAPRVFDNACLAVLWLSTIGGGQGQMTIELTNAP